MPDQHRTAARLAREKSSATSKSSRTRLRAHIGRIVWQEVEKKRVSKAQQVRFALQAVGEEGIYFAAISPTFHGQNGVVRSPDSTTALKDLMGFLWSEGWEPIAFPGPRDGWWEYRYRKLVE